MWTWASPTYIRGRSSIQEKKPNRAHFLSLLENTPKLSTITGYKYNTTLPMLNFSTILCTKCQPLSKTSPITTSFPAGPHAVLGLEVIFFFSMAFLTHFLPNFCKIILSWGQPVLMHKATMGFLVVYSKKNIFLQGLPWQRAKSELIWHTGFFGLLMSPACPWLPHGWERWGCSRQLRDAGRGKETEDLRNSSGLHCVPCKHSPRTLWSLHSFEGHS